MLRLRRKKLLAVFLMGAALSASSEAGLYGASKGNDLLVSARTLYQRGQYFRAARYAFAAAQEVQGASEAEAYSWVTLGLVQAGLPQGASYFFIRTLQSQDRTAIRRVLTQTEELLSHVGVDLFRKYLVTNTHLDDYDSKNQSVYLYLLGKTMLLQGQYTKASEYLNGVSSRSPFYVYALQLRGTARAIQGNESSAIRDFEDCIDRAESLKVEARNQVERSGEAWVRANELKAEDLRARCQAGVARTHYQSNRFREADEAYDHIPKNSFVWTDILFEQAWNAFAQQEYNRALGRLVSYKSPALKFVFNSEVDVLQAQSYLALCLYSDANEVINDFNSKYSKLGEEVKRFVEGNSDDLEVFYVAGKKALQASLHTNRPFDRLLNRFIRGPYFQTSVLSEKEISREMLKAERFSTFTPGGGEFGKGFPAFLKRVLEWRGKTARHLGGAFVKNSLLDYHSVLISDFEKMAFIKLEMLSRAKDKLLNPNRGNLGRSRGSREPGRKTYQYYWSFNGEFWTDELGDYVFGLESECDRS